MRLNKSHVAEVVCKHALELRKLSVKANLKVLAYLLEMVAEEADAIARSATRKKRAV